MSTHGVNCQMLSNPLLKQEGESRSPRDTPSGSSNYSTTGSKTAIPTSCDILSKLTADYKLHPSGKISRDPSPMSKMTASSERDKDNKQDKNRRKEVKNENARGKEGYIETELGRYLEKERPLDSRVKDGERGWMVRVRGQEYTRSPNGSLMSNVKTETEKDTKKRRKKGDTFPRIKRGDRDPDPRLMPTPEVEEERRQRDRPKREETHYWEEKINRIWTKTKEEGKKPGRRPAEDERTLKRETYKVYGIDFQDTAREIIDLQDMRDRVAARNREDMRLDMDERKAGMYSHQRRPERETHGRKDERRVPKIETDVDERELGRDKMRERRGEEGYYRGKMPQERGRDRQSDRGTGVEGSRRNEEANCEKYWETDRRTAEQVDRERERWMDTQKIFSDGRKRDDQNRRERRQGEIYERREDATGRNSRSRSDSAPLVPPRFESSGEWSNKGDSEKNRRDKDIYRERDTRRKGAAESERIGEKQRDPEGAADRTQRQQTRSEKQEKDRGGTTRDVPEQRRMWLKPQWGKNHTDEDSERCRRHKEGMRENERDVESQAEWGRDGRRVKAELDERYTGQTSYKERHGGRNEYGGNSDGVSVDGDDDDETENGRKIVRGKKGHLSDGDGGTGIKQQGAVEGENVVDNTEESGTEEEGGSDYLVCSGSDGGSDIGWKHGRDEMLTEDNFGSDEEGDERNEEFKNRGVGVSYEYPTAVSSKNSEADERKEDWTRKTKVIDMDAQGRHKKSKNVFCVIGQSHSWSETTELSLSEDDEMSGAEKDELNLEKHNHSSDDATLTSSRNYEQSVLSNQDKDGDHSTSRFTSGDAGEDIQYRTSKELQEKELGIKGKDGLSHLKMRATKRDSQTEKLLKRWRAQDNDVVQIPVPSNSYADVHSQDSSERIHSLDAINTESMRPEELDSIQIGMKGAWTTSEETKRHSQAAHMKWAKNVVRLYLGNSEEQVDEHNSEPQEDQGVNHSKDNREPEVVSQISFDLPTVTLTSDDRHWEPELEKDNLEEEFRGMRQANMHADHVTAMPVVTTTYTHTDTHLNAGMKEDHTTNQKTELSGHAQLEKADIDELRERDKETGREKEVEMCVSVTNTLYKTNSCPSLNYDSESDIVTPPTEGESQQVRDKIDQSVYERQTDRKYTEVEVGKMIGEVEEETEEGKAAADKGVVTETSFYSSPNLGPKAHFRRRAIRIPTTKRNGEREKVEEEEGVGRDRRARVFSPTDEDDKSKTWGGMDLRNVLDEIKRCQKNKGLFNATQLYQDYTNTTQEFEILQSLSVSVGEDPNLSPANSPPPARRPLPPLPTVLHPHSLSHTCSVTSAKNLPLPELPRSDRRPSSPRLSISLTQPSLLWRDLEDVRYSPELEELTEDQRRLQEVRFEVVTSEASYCRSLDIVVDHFVKSKQLSVLLYPQDKNWLFSRLAEVRTISRRFLSALEERMESNIMHFTVCDIIAEHCPLFRSVYVPYLTNQSYQDTTYQKLMNENPGFKQIVETLERSPICQRLPLRSFLVLPFQRITRIKLLVQNIVKRTTPGTVEATHAIKALKLLEKLIRDSNESISQMKNLESLVALNSKVNFECRTLPLVSPSRRLVREGPVTRLSHSLKEPEKNIYLHLFNDNLLLSVPKEGGRFTVIGHYPVESLHAEDCPVKLDTLQKSLFRLRILHDLLLLRGDSESDKLRWISAISRPHPEFDFSADQDYAQMQCIRAYVAQQPDELSLEKADVILVQQDSDNWVEGTRLSDLHSGWVPKSHFEAIMNPKVRKRNLSDALKLTTATATV